MPLKLGGWLRLTGLKRKSYFNRANRRFGGKMTEKERAKQLAEEHWNGYVAPTVEVHSVGANYTQAEVMAICKHHYISATIHGYGHAIEDERNGMFRPSIGEPLTTGEIAAIARPCSNCYDEKECGGGLRLASGDCLHYWAKDDTKCSVCKKKSDCAAHMVKGSCSLFEFAGERNG